MGFGGCALVLYLLWWDKPFDVDYSVPIYYPERGRERVINRLREIFEARNASHFIYPIGKSSLKSSVSGIGLT